MMPAGDKKIWAKIHELENRESLHNDLEDWLNGRGIGYKGHEASKKR